MLVQENIAEEDAIDSGRPCRFLSSDGMHMLALDFDSAVVKNAYTWEERLRGGETQRIEFKSGLDRKTIDPETAADIVKDKVPRYINAFLNSVGGAILFGVEDDGLVTGCRFTERQRVETVKVVDAAAQLTDPQVEVDAVRHWFAPVQNATEELFVFIVGVKTSRAQPIYYMSPMTCEAWIRRSESVYKMDVSLIREREAEHTNNPRRSWRHIAYRAIPFDDHIECLRELPGKLGAKQSRPWVFRRLGEIFGRSAEAAAPLVCLIGASGSGKSTLMASIVHHGKKKRPEKMKDGYHNISVVGWHFCLAGADETLSAVGFVHNFAASLCLSPLMLAFKKHASEHPVEVLRLMETPDATMALKNLLRLCSKLTPPGRRLAYVVDGIDESVRGQQEPGHPTIQELLWRCRKDCPAWLVFFIASRTLSFPGTPALSERQHMLCLDGPESEADVEAYIDCRIQSDQRLAEGASSDVCKQLAKFSGGNFQFARSVLDLVVEQRWDWEQALNMISKPSIDCISSGSECEMEHRLDSLYVSLFSQQFAGRFAYVQAVLEILVAARRPLHHEEIAKTLHHLYPSHDVENTLRDLKPYLASTQPRHRPEEKKEYPPGMVFETPRVSLQHLSFRQWLVDDVQNTMFLCNESRGHAMLAAYHISSLHSIGISKWLGQAVLSNTNRDQDFSSVSDKVADSQRAFHVLEAALHLSTTESRERSVQALRQLVGDVAICTPDSKGRSAIHTAAKHGNQCQYLMALDLLLSAASDAQSVPALQPTKDGKTPLMLAAGRGQHLALNVLLAAADVAIEAGKIQKNEVLAAADAALWLAASGGPAASIKCIRTLLEWGAGNAMTGSVVLKVSQVVQRGTILPSAERKLNAPCPFVNQRGQTALFLATKMENKDAVEALLNPPELITSCSFSYVDLAAGEGVGATPLFIAASCGNADLVALLLRHRASPCFLGQGKRDKWARTPLVKACALGHLESARAILATPEGQGTLNRGATHRRTALMEAVWHAHVNVVRELLAHPEIDVTLARDDGNTALHEAAYWGRGRAGVCVEGATFILSLLITYYVKHSISLDYVDRDGCTALCYAAAADADQEKWVSMLLEGRANACVQPTGGHKAFGWDFTRLQPGALSAQPWGGTPLEEAASRSNSRVVAALLSAMACRGLNGLDATTAKARELVSDVADFGRERCGSPLHPEDTSLPPNGVHSIVHPRYADQSDSIAPRLQPPGESPYRCNISPRNSPESPTLEVCIEAMFSPGLEPLPPPAVSIALDTDETLEQLPPPTVLLTSEAGDLLA